MTSTIRRAVTTGSHAGAGQPYALSAAHMAQHFSTQCMVQCRAVLCVTAAPAAAEIAALRFLRDQMDNDIAEGYVSVAMRDPQEPHPPGGNRRRRGGLHGHEPPPPPDADPGPPIIAFLAVTPDQIVHLAIPDIDGSPDARRRLPPPPPLSRAHSAASLGSAAARSISRRWPSFSGQLDDGGGGTSRGESGPWGARGNSMRHARSSSQSVFDFPAESRVLRRAPSVADLPPGIDWVVATLDVSLCPWWRGMFGTRGRGDSSSGALWRRMTISAGLGSLSRGLRPAVPAAAPAASVTVSLSQRSTSQPVTPGAAAVNSWFADTAVSRHLRLGRPASAAMSRAASFDSESSGAGSVPSLPRPWSGEPGAARPSRPGHASAPVDGVGSHVMWPGPVGLAAVSGEWSGGLVRGASAGGRLTPVASGDDAALEGADSAPGGDLSTVASSGLPLPPASALEDTGQLGVYTPPHDLEPSAAVPRGGPMFGGFGPLVQTGSRQQSSHAFHALDGAIVEESEERSGSNMTM